MDEPSYFEKYRFSIELSELQRKERVKNRMQELLVQAADDLCDLYDEVEACASALAPKDKEFGLLTSKAAVYYLLSGIIAGKNWDVDYIFGSGIYVPKQIYYPYQQIFKVFLSLRDLPCNFSEADHAISSGTPLFEAEAKLTPAVLGAFWRRLIDYLPPYEDNPYGVEPYWDLLSVFEGCYEYYLEQDESSELYEKLEALFIPHWQKLSAGRYQKLLEERAYHPDRAAAEAAVRHLDFSEHQWAPRELLAADFPQAARQIPPAQLLEMDEGEFIASTFEKEPKLAVQMWRRLLDTAQAYLGKPQVAEWLVSDVMEFLWTGGDALRPVLKELKADRCFASQVFQSAYVGYLQEELLNACDQLGEKELKDHLLQLLKDNPYPHEPLEAEEEQGAAKKSDCCHCSTDDPAWAKDTALPQATEAEFLPEDGSVYRYCNVQLPKFKKTLAYLAEGLPLKAGDQVEVPLGKNNIPHIGQVVSVQDHTRSTAPWPPERTKAVLRILAPSE